MDIADGIHSSRLATYLAVSHNDIRTALETYKWNLQIASAFQETLSVTEIVLRNGIDKALRSWNSQQPKIGGGLHSADWLIDPARPLNDLTKGARATANRGATTARAARWPAHPRKNAAINHDDLLSNLTFGVFAKLLPTTDVNDNHYAARAVLWRDALINAFPHLNTDPDGVVVSDRVARLHALRNRVSHMEPLLSVNISARYTDALKVIGLVNPAAREWCAGISRIRPVAKEDPRLRRGPGPAQRI